MTHVKLHIPGPVEVSEKTFRAFCSPMIGHRGQGFKDLYAKMQPQLQRLFYTQQLVYLSTSSAWGVMEGALRNLVSRKVLNCMCGAFSDKWFEVSERCGKDAEALQVPWGSPIRADEVDKKLAGGRFDALTLIHNETSTGVMSPLAEKLEDIFSEGLERRYARHAKLAQMTRDWAARHGFSLFPEKSFESITLTCVNNGAKPGGRVIDVAKFQKLIKDRGFLIDGGYGRIKGTTFRISNMGDETEATMNPLYAALDAAM